MNKPTPNLRTANPAKLVFYLLSLYFTERTRERLPQGVEQESMEGTHVASQWRRI